MKEIKLTRGQVALVDDDMFEELNQHKWQAQKDYNTFYAMRGHKKCDIGTKIIIMHRLIIDIPIGCVCDHINHNGLDNRRENLRAVSTRQNAQNKIIKKSSIYPGVHWSTSNKQWVARVRIGNTRKYLGKYDNERDAFDAYCNELKSIGEICLV